MKFVLYVEKIKLMLTTPLMLKICDLWLLGSAMSTTMKFTILLEGI